MYKSHPSEIPKLSDFTTLFSNLDQEPPESTSSKNIGKPFLIERILSIFDGVK